MCITGVGKEKKPRTVQVHSKNSVVLVMSGERKRGGGGGERGEQEKHGEEEEDVGAGRRRKALTDNNPATLHPSVGIKPQVHDDASSFPW